jgi:predicted regulator of Ras-like GTPase activity (Roadblock/LC7/MglB family)
MADSGAEAREVLESDLGRVLGDLRSLSGEIDAGYLVSGEGRLLASDAGSDSGVDRDHVAAMISALSGLSARRARERGHDGYSQVRVRSEEGYVLLTSLSGGSTLAATTGPEARVGLVLYDMRNARPEAERAIAKATEGENNVG